MPKIISECCELVNLCHINCFLDTLYYSIVIIVISDGSSQNSLGAGPPSAEWGGGYNK